MADLFLVRDVFGDEVVLPEAKWAKLVDKHEEITPYVELVRETIEHPNMVREATGAADSKVFYSSVGKVPDHRFWGCRLAVMIRYTSRPATLTTVYIASQHSSANLGNLLYTEPHH